MTLYFEPADSVLAAHARFVRAVVDEIRPPDFHGTMVFEQYWRDSPVAVTLRAEGIRAAVSTMAVNDFYGAEGESCIRETLRCLFDAAVKERDENRSSLADEAR